MNKRRATVKRQTKETDITLELNVDGKGNSDINFPCSTIC
jgi:imidazoleglycerol phosphate dehydratase HisB